MPNNNTATHFYQKRLNKNSKDLTLLERIHYSLINYELHRTDAVVNLLKPGGNILDIGTGAGNLLIKASDKGFSQLHGLDISKDLVKQANKNLNSEKLDTTLSVHNIDNKTDYQSNYFGTITMVAVLEHVFDVNFVLKEVHRILKLGGQLIIEVPNLAFLPRRLSILLGKLPRTGSGQSDYDIGHLHYFTHRSLTDLLRQHNFQIIKKTQSGLLFNIRQLWPQLLASNIIMVAIKKENI